MRGGQMPSAGLSGKIAACRQSAQHRREHLNLRRPEEKLKVYMDSSVCSEMEDKQDGEDAERKRKTRRA